MFNLHFPCKRLLATGVSSYLAFMEQDQKQAEIKNRRLTMINGHWNGSGQAKLIGKH